MPSSAPPQPVLKNLPSQKEKRRLNMSRKFSTTMDDLQTAMFSAGQKLNEITGYSDIEALKKSIEQQGIFLSFFLLRVFFKPFVT